MGRDFTLPATNDEIRKTKDALEANGFMVEVVDSLKEAKSRVLQLIPQNSEVFTATSVTLSAIGLDRELNNPDTYISVRDMIQKLPENESLARRRMGSGADYMVGSVHAITENGHVYIASNSGSQLPGYVYGASHVIWVVGSQKIVKNHDTAMKRLESYTLPLEDERAKQAYGVGSQISKLLIYRKEPKDRITIIICNESVGY